MGLAYGDVIMYRQAFVDKESIPSYKQRCEELKQTLKRTRQQEPEGEAIKTLNVSIGLKCKEKSGTSKSIKYTLKNNKSYTNDVSKKMSCEELHKMVREHYMISPARKTYLGLYDESSIQKLTVEQVYAQQKQKKKALAVYLYYPKSYADLEFKKMVDMDYSRFSSDEDDYPAFQSSNRSLPVISNITQSEAIQQEVNTLSPPESSTMPQTEVIGQEAYTLTLPGCSTVSQSEAVQQETNTLSLPGSSRSDIDNSNIGFQG